MKMSKQACRAIVKKKGNMTEDRLCDLLYSHGGRHSPNLKGMRFGGMTVIRPSPIRYVSRGNMIVRQWECKDNFGLIRLIPASSLIWNPSGKRTRASKNSGSGITNERGKVYSSYITSTNHIRNIVDQNCQNYKFYKNMKLHCKWDPRKNDSSIGRCAQLAMQWMRKHIGERPTSGHQLHVLKTKKYPHGFFGPGGIVWRHKMDRHDQNVLDLIHEWPKRKLREFVRREIGPLLARQGEREC